MTAPRSPYTGKAATQWGDVTKAIVAEFPLQTKVLVDVVQEASEKHGSLSARMCSCLRRLQALCSSA
jgi:hypothetical protein